MQKLIEQLQTFARDMYEQCELPFHLRLRVEYLQDPVIRSACQQVVANIQAMIKESANKEELVNKIKGFIGAIVECKIYKRAGKKDVKIWALTIRKMKEIIKGQRP